MVSVRIRLLGPLTVERDGGELTGSALGGVRERRLLAILALAAGDVVPKDVIIERLWDRLPQHPLAAIDTAVSLTRRALGSAAYVLETARPGYRLRCPTDIGEVDVLVADAAVGRGGGHAGRVSSSGPIRRASGSRASGASWTRRRIDVLLAAAGAAATHGDDSLAFDRYAAALAEDVDAGGRPPGPDGEPGSTRPARRGPPRPMSAAAGSCARSWVPIPPTQTLRALRADPRRGRRPAPAVARRSPSTVPFLGRRVELARLTRRSRTSAPCASCSANPASARAACSTRRSPCWTAGRSGPPSASGSSPLCRTRSSPTWRPSCSPTMSRRGAGRGQRGAPGRRVVGRGVGRPTVTLVIDDLQWADEPSLAVLGLVLRRRPRAAPRAGGGERGRAGSRRRRPPVRSIWPPVSGWPTPSRSPL